MLKKLAGAVMLAAVILSFSACSSEQAQDSGPYYSFTDDAGVSIVLKSKPQKVGVLFSSYAEAYCDAGGQIYVTVGESVERGIVDSDVLLVDSGAGKTIDTEALISFEPDFVICSADIKAQADAAGLLNSAGIPAAQFHVESFDDYLNMLKILTDITGDSAAYQNNGLDVKQNIDRILSEAQNEDDTQRVLFIRSGSGYSSAKAKRGDDHFACQMLSELGAYNIADDAPVLLDGLSIEHILEQNPDFIFITTMGDESAARAYMDSVLAQRAWQQLDAVKEGRYTYLPKDLFQFKPNSRWDEAYQYLKDVLYG